MMEHTNEIYSLMKVKDLLRKDTVIQHVLEQDGGRPS